MNIDNYINVLKKSPVFCLWGELVNNKLNIIGVNNKFNDLLDIENVKGKEVTKILNISTIDDINLIYENININENSNIDLYIPLLNKFYEVEIIHIEDNLFSIWLTKSYEYDKYIKDLLNKIDYLIWIKDSKGRYIYTNLNFYKLYNLSSEDLIGKSDFEVFTKDVASKLNESDKKIINKELDYISTLTFIDEECYDGSLYPIYDNKNEVIATIGIGKKITNIENSKLEIETQKKMLELVVNNIPDEMFFKDSNGIFRHCNEAFAKTYNLKRDEIIGKNDYDLSKLKNLNLKQYQEEDKKIIETKERIISESIEKSLDGKNLYMETIKVPFIDGNGIVGGILGISRDISHRKEEEREFERLRMEFFANLSHEFRTPLNLIFSAIQLLYLKLGNEKLDYSFEYIKYIDIIKQNSYRLLRLVNNMIDSTRLDVGSLQYNPVNSDIVNYIENIFDSVVEFANQNGIKMIFDTTIEEHIVAFDLEKMERIILNLISNAIKFNKINGQIEINLDSNKDDVIIEVKDTGIGIPKDKYNDIFEKFRQINNRMTKINEGSGIGLSLVKSLVNLHNGNIEMESQLGEYTKFIIKIPNQLTDKKIEIDEKLFTSKYIENIEVEFSDIYSKLNK